MINRSPSRSSPIPFSDPLHPSRQASSGAVRWSPPSPPGTREAEPAGWANRHRMALHSAHEPQKVHDMLRAVAPRAATPAAAFDRGTPARQALARYDGPHSLSVRSSATGRLYRFERAGQVLDIHADDVTLMRRIDDITIL